MIPTQELQDYDEFAKDGTKTAPGDIKTAQGFVATDVLPAEWANYFFNGSTKGITDLNQGVTSIESEINNVLAEKSITPSATDNTQLKTAINGLIADEASARATADSNLQSQVTANSTAISNEVTNRNTAITNAINALDVGSVGSDGGYIKTISQTDGKIVAERQAFDTAISSFSNNAVTNAAVTAAFNSRGMDGYILLSGQTIELFNTITLTTDLKFAAFVLTVSSTGTDIDVIYVYATATNNQIKISTKSNYPSIGSFYIQTYMSTDNKNFIIRLYATSLIVYNVRTLGTFRMNFVNSTSLSEDVSISSTINNDNFERIYIS